MPSRAIRQPNGLYARFSTVVDDFTHMNYSRQELLVVVFEPECGIECARGKMDRADADPGRYEEALAAVLAVHGRRKAASRRKTMSQ